MRWKINFIVTKPWQDGLIKIKRGKYMMNRFKYIIAYALLYGGISSGGYCQGETTGETATFILMQPEHTDCQKCEKTQGCDMKECRDWAASADFTIDRSIVIKSSEKYPGAGIAQNVPVNSIVSLGRWSVQEEFPLDDPIIHHGDNIFKCYGANEIRACSPPYICECKRVK
jgi:hypothetical protein